jgi:signal transduction histidine kinase
MKKLKLYLLPFGLSILALTGFLGYYLHFIYQNEKNQLSKQLQLLFDNACETEKNARWELLIKKITDDGGLPDLKTEKNNLSGLSFSKITTIPVIKDSFPKNTVAIQNSFKVINRKNPTKVLFTADSIQKIDSFTRLPLENSKTTVQLSFKSSDISDQKGSLLKDTAYIMLKDTNIRLTFHDTFLHNLKIIQPESVRKNKSFVSDSLSLKYSSAITKETVSLTLMPVSIPNVIRTFNSSLVKNNADVSYKIDSSSVIDNNNISGDEGKIYKVSPMNEFSFLIPKMLPQISLSVLVLIAVIFGFLSMIYSLNKQIILNSEKQNFLSNMTHELKTPISVVGIALEALQNFDSKNDINKRKEYIEIAQNENKKLTNLIDSILNFTKTSSTKLTLKKVNIDALIEKILIPDKIKTDKAGIILKKNLRINDLRLKTNEEAFIFIIRNLTDNAVKYNSNPEPKIDIVSYLEGSWVKIKVTDNGKPVPKEYREKIFEKFFRIDNHLVHDQKGYGLGLFIARSYAIAVGGKLEYESENQNNTFILSLPIN